MRYPSTRLNMSTQQPSLSAEFTPPAEAEIKEPLRKKHFVQQALSEHQGRYLNIVLRKAHRQGIHLDLSDAEDILHETLINILETTDRFEEIPNLNEQEIYFIRSLYNQFFSYLRDRLRFTKLKGKIDTQQSMGQTYHRKIYETRMLISLMQAKITPEQISNALPMDNISPETLMIIAERGAELEKMVRQKVDEVINHSAKGLSGIKYKEVIKEIITALLHGNTSKQTAISLKENSKMDVFDDYDLTNRDDLERAENVVNKNKQRFKEKLERYHKDHPSD